MRIITEILSIAVFGIYLMFELLTGDFSFFGWMLAALAGTLLLSVIGGAIAGIVGKVPEPDMEKYEAERAAREAAEREAK